MRADLDIQIGHDDDDWRLKKLIPTLRHLLESQAKTIVIGHRGRPNGQVSGELSLAPVSKRLSKLLKEKINFVYDITGKEAEDETSKIGLGEIVMLENLRFDIREEHFDPEFAKRLASFGDFYVNESFADSHREHASIVGIPKFLPHAAGLHFAREVENLSRMREKSKHPVVVIIGGAKTEKAKYIDRLLDIADWVLTGGLLPRIVSSFCRGRDGKACVSAGHLLPSGGDIDAASVANFSAIISQARTVVWNGPMGEFENPEYRKGTEQVAQAVVENRKSFKVVGGGDTISALQTLGILPKMNWVSTGGGSMLQFLAEGTLPGIEAMIKAAINGFAGDKFHIQFDNETHSMIV